MKLINFPSFFSNKSKSKSNPKSPSESSSLRSCSDELSPKSFNGKITKRELDNVFRQLSRDPPTDEELSAIVEEIDRDDDGCINLDELLAIGSEVGGGEIRDAFDVFDADGDGKISAEELLRVFLVMGDGGCSIDDCRQMIGGVDSDGDGYVGFEDFVRMMDVQR